MSGSKNYQNDVRSLKILLTKLKKHFSKELDPKFNMFLLCDFLHLMASSYLFFRDEGWTPNDGFRQVKNILIKEPDSPYLNEVIQLGTDYLADPISCKDSMIKNIDHWLMRLSNTRKSINYGKKFIVNFNFRNHREDLFYINICGAIMSDPYLSSYFIMGQIHNYSHIFKYSYSLFFDSQMESYDESILKKRLESFFSHQKRRVFELHMVNSAYIYEIMYSEDVYKHVEKLLSYINKSIVYIISRDGEYNSNKMFLIGLILSIILLDRFNLSYKKIISLSDFLSNKWIPEAYLQHVKYDKFETKRKAYNYHFSKLFDADKQIFDALKQVFILKNSEKSFNDLNWSRIGYFSSLIYEEVEAFVSKCRLPDLYLASLRNLDELSYKDKTHCWFLINIMEWMLNVLGIDIKRRSYFAYSLGKLYDFSS